MSSSASRLRGTLRPFAFMKPIVRSLLGAGLAAGVGYAAPPTLVQQPTLGLGTIVQSGVAVDMQFNIAGTAPVTVVWQHGGVDIPGSSSVVEGSIAHLFMVTGQPSTQGPYTAIATNAEGSSPITTNNHGQFIVHEGTWRWNSPRPTALGGLGLAALGDSSGFVLFGSRGFWATSPDGTSWSQLTSFTTSVIRGYTFGAGLHILWGNGTAGIASADGSLWYMTAFDAEKGPGIFPFGESLLTTRQIDLTGELLFGNGLFVALQGAGGPGVVKTSTDGRAWTRYITGVPETFARGAFGNGVFLALTASGQLTYSTNGNTWTVPVPAPLSSVTLLRYTNGRFFIGNNAGLLNASPDGVNWTPLNTGVTRQLNGLGHASGRYVLTGSNATILTSDNDGVTWTPRVSPITGSMGNVAFANNIWCILGANAILTSPDGITWSTHIVDPSAATFRSVAAAGGSSMVAVGTLGHVLRSTNGTDWTLAIPAGNVGLNEVAHTGAAYYVAGNSGTILTSADGTGWGTLVSGTVSDLQWIGALNGTLFASGAGGVLLTSAGGVNWTPVASGTTEHLNGGAFGVGTHVLVGSNGTIRTSLNGTTWSPAISGTTQPLKKVAFGNGIFVTVGDAGTLLTSTNGTTWTNRSIPIPENFSHVTYTGGVFVVSGSPSGVFVSHDGISWHARITGTTDVTAVQATVTFNDRVYGVGEDGVILSAQRAPEVGRQPSLVKVLAGTTAKLETIAGGSVLPTTYQWFKEGVPLSNGGAVSGANGPVLKIRPVQVGDAANYAVLLNNAAGAVLSGDIRLEVTPVPEDVTNQIVVYTGGFRLIRATQRFVQTVILTNFGPGDLSGPVSLVLDQLSANATLANATGMTAIVAPLGSPFVNLNIGPDGIFSRGESVAINLEFANPLNQPITYNVRILADAGNR